MFTISKAFAFSASHQLAGLPVWHPCSRLHGHNYTVTVTLSAAELDGNGMVLDYGELRPFRDWIDDNLDHRHLNDVMGAAPTAELLAQMLGSVLANVVQIPDQVTLQSVTVSETPKTTATWTRS